MPLLAKHAAKHDIIGLKETFSSSLTMVLLLTIPASLGLFILSEPIIRLIFERGAFTPSDTLATAQALSLYSIGLFAYSSNKVLVPVYYALEKTKYPVIASFIAICTNIVFINFTIDYLQHRAIALSMSCTMLINFTFLTVILYRKLNGFALKVLLTGVLKISIASFVMSLFLILFRHYLASWLSGSFFETLASLFFIIFVAVVLYGFTIHLLKLPEFSDVVKKIKVRFL